MRGLNKDEGRTDKQGRKEFIVETTGGPTKVFRYRRRKNPHFQHPRFGADKPPVKTAWYLAMIEELTQARRKAGLSQAKLSRAIGSSQSAVSYFERGRANPTVRFILKYAKAVGTDFIIKSKH